MHPFLHTNEKVSCFFYEDLGYVPQYTGLQEEVQEWVKNHALLLGAHPLRYKQRFR